MSNPTKIYLDVISDIHIDKNGSFDINIFNNGRGKDLIVAGDICSVATTAYELSSLNSRYFRFLNQLTMTEYTRMFIVAGNHEYKNDNYITIKECDTAISDFIKRDKRFIYLRIGERYDYPDAPFSVIGGIFWPDPGKIDTGNKKVILPRAFYKDGTKVMRIDAKFMANANREFSEFVEETYKSVMGKRRVIVCTHFPPTTKGGTSYVWNDSRANIASAEADRLIKEPACLWVYGHTHKKLGVLRKAILERKHDGVFVCTNQFQNDSPNQEEYRFVGIQTAILRCNYNSPVLFKNYTDI